MQFEFTPRQGLRFLAIASIIQGLVLLSIDRAVHINETRQGFLFDIVSRNTQHLEDFDLIALTELGLIKPNQS